MYINYTSTLLFLLLTLIPSEYIIVVRVQIILNLINLIGLICNHTHKTSWEIEKKESL